MAVLWQGKKNNKSDEVSYGKFLWMVIIGEYDVAYCWPSDCLMSAAMEADPVDIAEDMRLCLE